MSENLGGAKIPELFGELLAGVRLMEGLLSPNELARRVVRAAMAQPGVAGARLWRVERGAAEVWAAEGNLPAAGSHGAGGGAALVSETADPTLWTSALGSDDFRVRALEVRGRQPLTAAVQCQLDYLARFAAVVLALAERRGAMEELSSWKPPNG